MLEYPESQMSPWEAEWKEEERGYRYISYWLCARPWTASLPPPMHSSAVCHLENGYLALLGVQECKDSGWDTRSCSVSGSLKCGRCPAKNENTRVPILASLPHSYVLSPQVWDQLCPLLWDLSSEKVSLPKHIHKHTWIHASTHTDHMVLYEQGSSKTQFPSLIKKFGKAWVHS